jgi:uncharacterized protein (DUF433 family)
VEPVAQGIGLVVGDLWLASFEDELSAQWPGCLDGKERAFRVVSAFWRVEVASAGRSDTHENSNESLGRNRGESVRRMRYDRTTANRGQMGGQPCIRGLRIPVATVLSMVGDGMTIDEVIQVLPDLEREDVLQAVRYAAEAVREREVPLRQPA